MGYAREHMAAGLLGALGCGLAIGLASRALPRPGESQDPKMQARKGLHMLGAAGLLLLTRAGRGMTGRLAEGFSRSSWRSLLPRP